MTRTDNPGAFNQSGGWRIIGWGLLAGLLAIPAIGMMVSSEVNWGPEDFIIAAILLGTFGLVIEGIVRLARRTPTRIVLFALALAALLLIWAELAVGVFGSPIAGS